MSRTGEGGKGHAKKKKVCRIIFQLKKPFEITFISRQIFPGFECQQVGVGMVGAYIG